jgi:hypothetical protein
MGELLATWVPKDFSTPLMNARLKGPWEDCRGLVSMHIIWSDMLINVSRVVFRWIVAQVFLTRLIIKFELFLCLAIQQPEVLHLHCTGTLAFDCVIDDANGSGVVDVNGCWWL